jgi:TonB family protein
MKPKYLTLSLFFTVCLFVLNSAAQVVAPKAINGGVLNGKAVSLPKPQYPDEARVAKVGGAVAVQVTIDEGGNVIEAKAVPTRAAPKEHLTVEEENQARLKELLEPAAEDAARQAQFSPTLLNGTPVKVTGQIVYNFLADNDKAPPKMISGGILNGKAISLPHPEYPQAAAAVRASGAVSVQVTIDENGNVISAAAASGHPLLRAAAESAAREAKFSPTLLSGNPVKVSGILTYNFAPPKKEQ